MEMFQRSSGKRGFTPWKTAHIRLDDLPLSEAARIKIRAICVGTNWDATTQRPEGCDPNAWAAAVVGNLFIDTSEISSQTLNLCTGKHPNCQTMELGPEFSCFLNEKDVIIQSPNWMEPTVDGSSSTTYSSDTITAPQYIRSVMTWIENQLTRNLFAVNSAEAIPYIPLSQRKNQTNAIQTNLLSITSLPKVCIQIISDYSFQSPEAYLSDIRLLQRICAYLLRVLVHIRYQHYKDRKPGEEVDYDFQRHWDHTFSHLTSLMKGSKLFFDPEDRDDIWQNEKVILAGHRLRSYYTQPLTAFAVSEWESGGMAFPRVNKTHLKRILTKCNELRFSKEIQEKLSLRDDSDHFESVYVAMYQQVVCDPKDGVPIFTDEKYGIKPTHKDYKMVVKRVMDELFSHRHHYRNDAKMQEFFQTLIHVKYDLTKDGDLQIGDPVPDLPLYTPILSSSGSSLDSKEINLSFYVKQAQEAKVPLVLNCGSWT